METPQLRFALATSLAVAILAAVLALLGMPNWGLGVVALLLLATTSFSWHQNRHQQRSPEQGGLQRIPVRVRPE